MSSSYYEEFINFSDLKSNEEFLKFYINEDFNDAERIHFIIKKGHISQKAALLQDLPNLDLDNETLNNTIATIIENIEVWDNSLSTLFSDCLVTVTETIIKKINGDEDRYKITNSIFYNGLINLILGFYINIIENNENDLTVYYLRGFDDIIQTLSKYRKVLIESEIIEKASSMGSFGKKNTLRRYSLFFCTCLSRIESKMNEELFKRFMILSSDSDLSIRIEFSYQVRFILELLDQSGITKNIIKILENYLNEDDIIIKTEIIISIFLNISKFTDQEFLIFYNNMVSNYFENNIPIENLKYRDKVLFTFIEEIARNSIQEKFYANLIKNFIKKNFLLYEKPGVLNSKEALNAKSKQIQYDEILNYLKDLNIIFTLHNENNFMTDFLIYLVRILFDGNSSCNNQIYNSSTNQEAKNLNSNPTHHNSNVSSHTNNNISSIHHAKLNSNLNLPNLARSQNHSNTQIVSLTPEIIESRKLFYKHIDKFIEVIPQTLLNKLLYPKLFQVFEIQNTSDLNNSSYNNPNTNNHSILQQNGHLSINVLNKNLIFVENVLNNIENILSASQIDEDEDFLQGLLNVIPKLDELITHYKNNNNNWRLIKKITFILSFDGIFRNNASLDLFVHKIFDIAKKLFLNDCFEIKIESVKILAKISKSRLIWDELMKFVEAEILINKNYYNRRLYLYFFEEMTKNLSYKFLNEKGQIEELMKLINDNNQILSKFLKIIKLFFPLVTDDKIKFLIYNKLETIRKQINNREIVDKEVIKSLKEFDLLNEEMKKKNTESNELQAILSNERLKVNEELSFYNTITFINNPDSSRKEEVIPKKIKKTKNRLSTSNSNAGTPTTPVNFSASLNGNSSLNHSKHKNSLPNPLHNNSMYPNNLPSINSNRKAKRIQSVSDRDKKIRKESINNEYSKLKLSSEVLGPIETNMEFPVTSKRKEISAISSVKTNNDYPGFNQFTITNFHNFKNNKATLIKTDQLLIPNSHQKDNNLGYLTKNYWTSDFRNNASPSKLSKITIPSKLKPFSNPSSSKTLNTKLK